MAYIGRGLDKGNYLKLDSIKSQFDGINKTFNLSTGGVPFYPGSAYAILVSVAGVILEPNSQYTIDKSQITFLNPPSSSDSFFCISLGTSLSIGIPGDGTVTGEKLAGQFNYDSGLLYLDSLNDRIGIGTTSPTSKFTVQGDVRVSGVVTATTFYGDGSQLTGISASGGIAISTNTTNQNQYINYATSFGSTTGLGATTLLVYNPSSGNLGIGTTDPTSKLYIVGDGYFTGVVTASSFSGNASSATYATTAGIATSVIINPGVGIATAGGTVGTGATILDFRGSGISTVTVSAGIATINIIDTSGGGGGTIAITDDTSTNATYYVGIANTTTGNLSTLNVSSTKLTFNPSTGNLVAGGTVTANSDENLKTNIKTIENALDKVLSLRGVEFDRIDTGDHQIGVIAQEVEKIIPEVVYPKLVPDCETKSVAYSNLVALLIEAIKEQDERITELERRLEEK